MESNRLKLLIDMHHPQNSTETEHYRSSQHIGLSYKTLQTCASWKAQSQVDSDWLSLFLLFITWRKSESDSKYHCIPPCHCSCAVDFPFLIALQRLYTYRYSYPWCDGPSHLKAGRFLSPMSIEKCKVENLKRSWSGVITEHWARSANICRSSPLIVTALSAFFLPAKCVFLSPLQLRSTRVWPAVITHPLSSRQAGRLRPRYITRLGFHLSSVCSSALLRRFLVRGQRMDKSVI